MLHITNGDSAATTMRRSGAPGEVLPWRDVLHEGPVPANLPLDRLSEVRARFLSDQGWGPSYDEILADFRARDGALTGSASQDEVVLWFEHDLYDQLQLVQVLDALAGQGASTAKRSLICVDSFPGKSNFHGLGELNETELASLFPTRAPISDAQLTLARSAWQAFRASAPADLEALLSQDTSALPFLRPALVRLLEEYPAVGTGLSRTERQLLEVIAAGQATPVAIFLAWQEKEEAPFMGDTPLWSHLHRLSTGAHPLVAREDGMSFALPASNEPSEDFRAQRLTLTDVGRAVLAGQADHLARSGIDRWIGGVHLQATGPLWRWDASGQRLVRTA